jgi:hypothetical protein
MHWDAPVAISVFRRIRGKQRPALCMSLYVTRRTLYIQQLQGVCGTDVPRDLGGGLGQKYFWRLVKSLLTKKDLRR